MKKISIMFTLFIVAGCGLRSPPPSQEESFTRKGGATLDEVVDALRVCGKYRQLPTAEDPNIDNVRAKIEECMFNKGFYYVSGDGGYCADPYYRSKLPFCKNTPVRPENGYFGK